MLIAFLVLYARSHAAWPDYQPSILAPAIEHAMRAEHETGVPATLLIAIAKHESDLEPGAVSWRANGVRLDERDVWSPKIPHIIPVVCGYLSAMAHDVDDCRLAVMHDGAMLRGAREIAEWMATCHGNLRCALSGHAGGNAGADDARHGRTSDATRFADYFMAQAHVLGAP